MGHDSSLYRVSAPRDGLTRVIPSLYDRAETLLKAAANMQMLRGHATASALSRAGFIDYAQPIVGGTCPGP